MSNALESILSKWSYRINSKKLLLELSFGGAPVLVLHLQGLRRFTDEVFSGKAEEESARVSQLAKAFIEMFSRRYPTVKKSLKDFKAVEKKNFRQILEIIDSLNARYPEAALTYQRYLKIHFLFYAHNFETAPKPSFCSAGSASLSRSMARANKTGPSG